MSNMNWFYMQQVIFTDSNKKTRSVKLPKEKMNLYIKHLEKANYPYLVQELTKKFEVKEDIQIYHVDHLRQGYMENFYLRKGQIVVLEKTTEYEDETFFILLSIDGKEAKIVPSVNYTNMMDYAWIALENKELNEHFEPI